MGHLHNFQHQVGMALGNIGQKIKSFAEVAGAVKGIVDTGIFLKNTLAPVATVAAALAWKILVLLTLFTKKIK